MERLLPNELSRVVEHLLNMLERISTKNDGIIQVDIKTLVPSRHRVGSSGVGNRN